MISPVKIWRNQKKIQRLLNLQGIIISYTRVYVPPSGFIEQAPYVIVVVEGENKKRYTAQLVDYDESNLRIGQRVVSVLRRTLETEEEGVIPYGIKFRPI